MDPIGPCGRFRVELDGGEVVESVGRSVVLTMPPTRAHRLAQLLDESVPAVRSLLGLAAAAADRALARVLEDGAAALGDPHATHRPSRMSGSVSAARRLAAVELLGDEDALSAVGRVAAVDAAARWLEEDAGGELAHALLTAVCSVEATANRAYLALLGA